MATVIAPPEILSTQRVGKDIYVRYQAGASGYTVMIYELRTETSGWWQATQETTRQGHYTVTSWGTTPLDVNTPYYVRMRARHSSGVLTDYSNEVKVDPITVAPPKILAATRTGAFISVQYEAGASGYTAMYYQLRTTSRGWSQATSETTLNGRYTITSWAGQALDPLQTYWVRASAGHTSGRRVAWSNEVQVGPWQVAAPSIVSATRTAEKQVRLNLSGVVSDAQVVPQIRQLPDGQWSTLSPRAVSAGSPQLTIAVPSGVHGYAVQVAQRQHSVTSNPSSSTTVEAWWQKPPSATIGSPSRAADGTITVPFSGSPTARAPWTSVLVRWQVDGSPTWYSRTLPGTARTVTITADKVRAVTVEVLPRNAAGDATSAASTKVAAGVVAPSALGAPTVTWAGTTPTISWTLPPTAADRRVERVAVERVAVLADGRRLVTTIATVAAPANTATDRPPSNALISYRLIAHNAAGASESTSPESPQAATVPLGASSLQARRTGPDADLQWTLQGATTAQSWQLEFTTSTLGRDAPEPDWYPLESPGGAARSATHAMLAAGVSHTWRIRPQHPLMPEGVSPDWRYSATLSADVPPAAPVIAGLSSLDPREDIEISFEHRPFDGSAQTYAHVRFRRQGTTTWTNRYPGTSATATIPAGTFSAGDRIEVQVATRGKHPTTGAYASRIFTLRARPEVSILAPSHGSTVTSSTVRIELAFTGAVQETRLTLLDGAGREVHSRTLAAHVIWATLPVEDASSYRVRAEAWDGYQWSLPAEVAFDTELTRPPRPTLTAEVVGESVALGALVPSGLTMTRLAWMLPWDKWTPGRNSSVDRRSLNVDGTFTPAVVVGAGSVSTLDVPLPERWPEYRVCAGAEVLKLTPSATARARMTLVSGAEESPGEWVESPTYQQRSPVHVQTSLTAGALVSARLEHYGQGDAAVWAVRPHLIADRPSTGPMRCTPFDANTVDPEGRYEYGWYRWGQVAYEATYAFDGGDLPVEATEKVSFYRSYDGGVTWDLLGEASDTWSIQDDTPPLRKRLLYKVRAYARGGGWSESAPVEVVVESDHIVIDWTGPDGPRTLRGIWNPNLSHTQPARHVKAVRYAGDAFDTHYWGPPTGRTVSADFVVLDDDEITPAEWLAIGQHPGVVTYRDPSGVVISGAVTGELSWSGTSSIVQSVKVTVAEGVAG
ncbi:hypothetical protein [Tessaracoccus massiliensis]|uniref:hypothetical protein n=1 Tax=Tessaracoccus massiliensis TaxID=1522311 RepID=UPI00058FB2D1|nr:hypothetical protein [Tessaracoccus massiliensis]